MVRSYQSKRRRHRIVPKNQNPARIIQYLTVDDFEKHNRHWLSFLQAAIITTFRKSGVGVNLELEWRIRDRLAGRLVVLLPTLTVPVNTSSVRTIRNTGDTDDHGVSDGTSSGKFMSPYSYIKVPTGERGKQMSSTWIFILSLPSFPSVLISFPWYCKMQLFTEKIYLDIRVNRFIVTQVSQNTVSPFN